MRAKPQALPRSEVRASTGGRPIRRRVVFTIVALSLLMMAIDSTIVSTALDALQHDLRTTINWVGWTITAYGFGYVLMLPISGKLSERYGHYFVFLASTITFTVASLFCGLATNIYVLIALRAVQAVGGAGFMPSATGIIVDHFGRERDRAVSLFGSVWPIGMMIGPIFGGLFVEYWTWRGVFFVNVPIGVLAIVLTMRYVPRDRPESEATHSNIDSLGATLLGAGLFAIMFAVSMLGEPTVNARSPIFFAPLLLGLGLIFFFVRHVNRTAEPFIIPYLIYGRGFGAMNLLNGLYGGFVIGLTALIPLYATTRYGINALDSGTLLVAQGLAIVILSIAAVAALRRTGYRLPIYVASIAITAGLLLLGLRPASGVSPYVWLAGAAFVVGSGSGWMNPASRNAGLHLAPEHSATVAALRSMFLQIGAIVAISIATAILAGTHDSGAVQGAVYIGAAVLYIALIPAITTRIPEHHGSW